MDIIMPGGRHIYLRAASTAERQQWLLALGVAKQEENVIDSGKEGGNKSTLRRRLLLQMCDRTG